MTDTVESIDEELAELDRLEQEAIAQDPFWFFIPNDGEITPARREVLAKYLKEEDIPAKVDSQLDALLCMAPIVGVSGGNRSSKTVTGTIKGIIKSTGELPDSLKEYAHIFEDVVNRAKNKFIKGRVTAVDNKQLNRVVIPTWQTWIPREYLKDGSWEKSYRKEFDLLTLYRKGKPCATVEFLTNTQDVDSAQGGDLDWATFDEEPERAKYKETLLRFGTAERLDIEIDWTPTKGLTWATDLFHDGIYGEEDEDEIRTDDAQLFKLTTVTNRFVNPETIVKIMDAFAKVASYDEMKMRLLGDAISLSGLIYGNLFTKDHVIEPFEITKEFIVYRGLDPHMVKPSVCVELAVDRMENYYVIGTYAREAVTADIKKDLKERSANYRLGQTRCDKSADSTIRVLGDRNVFKELSTGENAIPAMFRSEKFTGSIHAGVDEIKKLLKINEKTKKPRLFVFRTPENKLLINAFNTMERETYTNEDDKGVKDRIKEGKHDAHAAMRYIFQSRVPWLPPVEAVPDYIPVNEAVGY